MKTKALLFLLTLLLSGCSALTLDRLADNDTKPSSTGTMRTNWDIDMNQAQSKTAESRN